MSKMTPKEEDSIARRILLKVKDEDLNPTEAHLLWTGAQIGFLIGSNTEINRAFKERKSYD